MNLPLRDRVIVVTGGSGLLGVQFVRAIADSGGIAIIADRDVDRSERIVGTLRAEDSARRIEFVCTDITSADSIDSVIATLGERYGRIDGLVNSAYPRNPAYGRRFEDVTYHDFTENLGMHVGGYFLTSQRFLPPLGDAPDGGVIVNIGSIYGVVAPRFQIYQGTDMTMPVEYAAIKAAVIHLTRYLAQYTKGRRIRVNCLSPGGVLDRQPDPFLEAYRSMAGEKGMLAPGDLTGALVFLLSDASRYVTGQNLVVDDGWSL